MDTDILLFVAWQVSTLETSSRCKLGTDKVFATVRWNVSSQVESINWPFLNQDTSGVGSPGKQSQRQRRQSQGKQDLTVIVYVEKLVCF